MKITKEIIQERKASLQAQLDQLTADANAITGAMQDCDYFISVLEAEEEGEECPTQSPSGERPAEPGSMPA